MRKEITLPVGGITIKLVHDENNIPIRGDIFHTELKTKHEDEEDELYNAAMDGIISLVLAHAMANIDVTTPNYIGGLRVAIEACANNF